MFWKKKTVTALDLLQEALEDIRREIIIINNRQMDWPCPHEIILESRKQKGELTAPLIVQRDKIIDHLIEMTKK